MTVIIVAVQVVLIALKLDGGGAVASWSWLAVLAPLWAPVSLAIAVRLLVSFDHAVRD